MNAAYQTTALDLGRALSAGLAVKPAKVAQKSETPQSIMADAHRRYDLHRQGKAKTFIRTGKIVRELPEYDHAMFSWFLSDAWNRHNFAQSKFAWEDGTLPTVTIDDAAFQSCRTDAAILPRLSFHANSAGRTM